MTECVQEDVQRKSRYHKQALKKARGINCGMRIEISAFLLIIGSVRCLFLLQFQPPLSTLINCAPGHFSQLNGNPLTNYLFPASNFMIQRSFTKRCKNQSLFPPCLFQASKLLSGSLPFRDLPLRIIRTALLASSSPMRVRSSSKVMRMSIRQTSSPQEWSASSRAPCSRLKEKFSSSQSIERSASRSSSKKFRAIEKIMEESRCPISLIRQFSPCRPAVYASGDRQLLLAPPSSTSAYSLKTGSIALSSSSGEQRKWRLPSRDRYVFPVSGFVVRLSRVAISSCCWKTESASSREKGREGEASWRCVSSCSRVWAEYSKRKKQSLMSEQRERSQTSQRSSLRRQGEGEAFLRSRTCCSMRLLALRKVFSTMAQQRLEVLCWMTVISPQTGSQYFRSDLYSDQMFDRICLLSVKPMLLLQHLSIPNAEHTMTLRRCRKGW